MDRRKMKKNMKAILASFTYTRYLEFIDHFVEESGLGLSRHDISSATRKRIRSILNEYARGDIAEPKYD